jgi:hypothetical protein
MYLKLMEEMESAETIGEGLYQALEHGLALMLYGDNPFNPVYVHHSYAQGHRALAKDAALLICRQHIAASKSILN